MDTAILDILHAGQPGGMLRALLKNGDARLPCFLREAPVIPAGPIPYHTGSVLDHLTRCMDAVAGDALAVWMAIAHDAGKLTTPRAMLPHHYGHERRGAVLAALWAREMEMPEQFLKGGVMAARLHMKAGRYAGLRPGTKYHLLCEVENSGCAEAFWKVVDADTRSHPSRQAREDWRRIRSISADEPPEGALRQKIMRLLRGGGKMFCQAIDRTMIK